MAHEKENPFEDKRGTNNTNTNTNSSSSDSSDSASPKSSPSSTPPSTPGSPIAQPAAVAATPAAPPRSSRQSRHTRSSRYGRGHRHSRRASDNGRLGAIDETSEAVAPDIPARNPTRLHKLYAARLFSVASLTKLYSRHIHDGADIDTYDQITGPAGEKFSDLRQNQAKETPAKRRRRRFCCIVILLIVAIIAALAIGLGVGLTRNRKGNNTANLSPGPATPAAKQAFPLGTWEIPTYLTSQSTSCTPNPATWRCYPYTLYSTSATASLSTLAWQIWSPTNTSLDLRITSSPQTFSYSFSGLELTLSNTNTTSQQAWTFTHRYLKTVIPNADITPDGSNVATRCYYPNTLLTAWLYTSPLSKSNNSETSNAGGNGSQSLAWPNAIKYVETITQPPECYLYVNGANTARVDLPSSSAAGGSCNCNYQNYDLS